jgi:cytidine deaminase
MIEFGEDLPIYLIQPDGSYDKVILRDLLPGFFGPEDLKVKRVTENTTKY